LNLQTGFVPIGGGVVPHHAQSVHTSPWDKSFRTPLATWPAGT
jgi:hypothetical protein